VDVSGSKSAETGEELEYNIRSGKTGKLWIVQVDPNDKVSMVYPNSMAPDNRIRAGQSVKIPPENAEWSFRAGKPLGKSILAFMVTTGNTTIADIFNNPGKKELNMEKAIRVISNSEWGIGKLVVDIE
jgi:hypothetical protein